MDEQRLQAYIDLVQQLRDCPQSQQLELLQSHIELVDVRLLQIAREDMRLLRQQQDTRAEQWPQILRQIAELDIERRTRTQILARQFLSETLELVIASRRTPQQIYRVWEQQQEWFNAELLTAFPFIVTQLFEGDVEQQIANATLLECFGDLIRHFSGETRWLYLELSISAYEPALQAYTRHDFSENQARVQINLGNAYLCRVRGDRAENLELAISAYNSALEIYTCNASLEDCARTQNNLAFAYSKRIRGNQAENLELAISACQLALQIYTHDAFPEDWARAQVNLGNAYLYRIQGDRTENLEQAIRAFHLALQVFTHDVSPGQWAVAQEGLGNAYNKRILGEQAENIEQAISAYNSALQIYSRNTFPEDWAMVQNSLGNAYSKRTQGNRAGNIEQAISAYNSALQVFTCSTSPEDWAMTQYNLALAYSMSVLENRSENLERAIEAYHFSLQVYTRDTFPEQWAMVQGGLGNTYSDRIREDRAENLERAIEAYHFSLQVYTRDTFPEQWAMVQGGLGNAYCYRIRESKTNNLEQAISACQLALQVFTHNDFPQQWATAQNILANAYSYRIEGDRAENLEQSISACQLALRVFTPSAFPKKWATTQLNLAANYSERLREDRAENLEQAIGIYLSVLEVLTRDTSSEEWATAQSGLADAYSERLRGDRAENIERAISAYELALQVRTRDAFPEQWALTQNNLALAYSKRIRGNRAENIEQAIVAYQLVLQVHTREAFPEYWATTQNNLASAYSYCIQGDRAENIEKAISAYELALQVRTRDAFPEQWATTQYNLGNAYLDSIRGGRVENLEEAVSAYELALQIFTPETFPNDCRRTSRTLADLHFRQQRWELACTSYTTTLKAAEILYQSCILLDSRAIELTETVDLPRRAAYALARAGNLQAAALTLEQGRARGLSEILERDRSDLSRLQHRHPALFNQYQDITAQLRNLEAQQRLHMTSKERHSLTPKALRTDALQLRQTLMETIEQIRQVEGYADFLAQPDFSDIQQAVRPSVPLVYLVPTPLGSFALVITTDAMNAIWLDKLTEEMLQNILRTWFCAYGEWLTALQNYKNEKSTENLQARKEAEQAWHDAIDQATHQLWEPLMAPLIHHLKTLPPSHPTPLSPSHQATLIPTGYLSLLPLHAAWTEDSTAPTGKRYALDEILFTYAPNARSLTAAEVIAQRNNAEAMLAINNPRNDLPKSSREVFAAIARFPQHKVLEHEEATIAAVKAKLAGASIVHFACHGKTYFTETKVTDPETKEVLQVLGVLDSGLQMSDGLLTLRDLFDLRLSEQGGIRLAILSACETGLIGIELADEAIGLPTGLLQAGVAGVVASLWSVSDLSTMMLLARFYDLWCKEGIQPAEALRQAQYWIRDTPSQQKAKYFETSHPELFHDLILLDPNYFAHPFYWAAFSYTGV